MPKILHDLKAISPKCWSVCTMAHAGRLPGPGRRKTPGGGDRWCCVCNISVNRCKHYSNIVPTVLGDRSLEMFSKRQHVLNTALDCPDVLQKTESRLVCDKCMNRAEKLGTLLNQREEFQEKFLNTQKARGRPADERTASSQDNTPNTPTKRASGTRETLNTPTKPASGARAKRLSNVTKEM